MRLSWAEILTILVIIGFGTFVYVVAFWSGIAFVHWIGLVR